MDKGLLFLTFALICFWLIFDDFMGKKRLSTFASKMTPQFSTPTVAEAAKAAVNAGQNTVNNVVTTVTGDTGKQYIQDHPNAAIDAAHGEVASIIIDGVQKNPQIAVDAAHGGVGSIIIDGINSISKNFTWNPSVWSQNLWKNIWGGK